MNYEYMGKILLSLSIFAPGLILLAFLSVVGVVMVVESMSRLNSTTIVAEFGKNPEPGRIIANLEEDMNSEESISRKKSR